MQSRNHKFLLASALTVALSTLSSGAWAQARCGGDFNQWMQGFKRDAAAAGIPTAIIEGSLRGISPDASVIKRDRSQSVFAQTFLEFSANKVNNNRMTLGKRHLQQNAALFQRIEQQFGVPAAVLTAYWGLESDFGGYTGNFSTLRSLATLAHDCRRPGFFRNELVHALQLIQKGDLTPAIMKGAWAGEIGQLQFIPSSYNKHAIDYDGDRHRDLINSRADALASAANLLHQYGWRAGQPWLVEVKVPAQMNWALARLDNKLPIQQWSQQGVTQLNGQALRGGGQAALLLPMGRLGPAFLAYPNFDVMLRWNESTVYTTTAAYFATRLAGAGPVRSGNAPVPKLSLGQVQQLQQKLSQRGLPVGKIDGIIGEQTRAAVRTVQQQLGLPADGYPDPELLRRL